MRTAIESLPTPPAGVKYIPITQGKFAIVDEEDYEWLMQWKWFHHKGYAIRNRSRRNSQPPLLIYMHRVINRTPEEIFTDHVNLLRLDNRRCNLRNATVSQNGCNACIRSNNSTGFKGVSWNKRCGKFSSNIAIRGRQFHLGYFDTSIQAHEAYVAASERMHGEFARAC